MSNYKTNINYFKEQNVKILNSNNISKLGQHS